VANGDAVGARGFRRIARLLDRTFLEFGRLGSCAAWDVPETDDADVNAGAVGCWNPPAWSNVSRVSTVEALFVSETEGWLPLLRGSRATVAAMVVVIQNWAFNIIDRPILHQFAAR